MTGKPHAFDFPLLFKELNEQAARPRTYVVRIAYGIFAFTILLILFHGQMSQVQGILGRGGGREMFDWLIRLQFACVYVFLPVMTCGVLTSEKERNTLGMLLITSLRPIEILLQKLFARLIPMLSFLLLSMPLMAVAYSFGGVTETQFWSGIGLIVLTMLQVGSVALMCSAFFRTTTEAFLGCCVLLVALSFCFSSSFGPGLYEVAQQQSGRLEYFGGIFGGVGYTGRGALAVLMIGVWRSLLLIGVCLFLSRHFLASRAFVNPRNALLELFKRLDAVWKRANDTYTGGIVLVNDDEVLPDDQPVAWRETRKKSLGTARYLFRVLVAVEVPLLFTFQLLRGPTSNLSIASISGLLFLVWGVGSAMVALHAASLISTERSRESLSVLLATPMTGRDILSQKMRGVWRLVGVLCIPLMSVYLFEEWWRARGWTMYLVYSMGTMIAYLPFVAWCGLLLGLRSRSPLRTLLQAIVLLVVIVAVPAGGRAVLAPAGASPLTDAARYAFVLSPSDVILAIETGNADGIRFPEPAGLCYGINIAVFVAATFLLRRYCLRRADVLLGRQCGAGESET